MELDTIEIRQVAPTFAAEIHGIDASKPLSPRDLATLVETLDTYGVAILPGQHLTPEQQIAVSEQLGELCGRQRANGSKRRTIGQVRHQSFPFDSRDEIEPLLSPARGRAIAR